MTDPTTGAAGNCSLCGVPIASATALRCVACERAHTRRCPECVDGNGRPLHKYQRHKGCHSDQPCTRCGVHHAEPRQLDCPVCHGERWVLQLPEGAAKC